MRIISNFLILVIILALLWGCEENKIYKKQEIEYFALDDTTSLKVNEIAYNSENELRLEIDSVLTDSRCPTGVNCVWEGNAEVRFNLIMEGSSQYSFNLNTNPKFQTDTLLNGFRFSLVGVLPYPEYGETIEHDDYKVEIVVAEE